MWTTLPRRKQIVPIQFTKRTVATVENNVRRSPMNVSHTVGDIDRDGRPDIVISGRNGRMVWLENSGADLPWVEHLIDDVDNIEAGSSTIDLTGNGYPDVINGCDYQCDEICWWEHPGHEGDTWIKRTILKTGATQFHDTLIGDALNDGNQCLVFTNQHGPEGTTVYCIPLPKDPRVTPWPDVTIVAQGLSEELVGPDGKVLKMQPAEGIAIGDLDGDGENELVCGTHWFKRSGARWQAFKFAQGYITTKIVIADVDGDGQNEILLSEGDPCIYGKTQGGKAAWFKPKDEITTMWEEHVLEESLLDAHTLVAGDLRGTGAMDVIVGEIGVASESHGYKIRPPRILFFANDGVGHFTRHILDDGTGIHDGVLADMRGVGRLDLVGKPLHGAERWDVHVYYNDCGG
jgi:hypothetical protein